MKEYTEKDQLSQNAQPSLVGFGLGQATVFSPEGMLAAGIAATESHRQVGYRGLLLLPSLPELSSLQVTCKSISGPHVVLTLQVDVFTDVLQVEK